ncbi:disease resistance protein [Trifolium repens]|nr:disease resistance protein [Trifolium repens]
MIGLYGESGSGKTTLVNEVAKKADHRKMFDEVISITVSQTPNIRDIQKQTEHLSLWFTKKERILVIVDSLWREFNLKDIGVCLNDFNKGAMKIIVITSDQHVCTLMNCQKEIHLGILSEDESWILFQKHAQVDDQFSDSMDSVPRKLCDECKGLPITIKTLASSLKGKQNTEWEIALAKLRDSEALGDPLNCLKLCYDYLLKPDEAQLLQVCSLYPQEHHIPSEDLVRCALGLGIQSNRIFIQTLMNKLFESSMQMCGSVKIHDMVRDTALWIPDRQDNCKILVNVDKPLSTVAEDNRIKDCFAVSSWWYNENPSFCELHAPNLKMLLVNISAHSSLNSLDLSPLTFEGIQGLQVFSLTINYKIVPISFPQSINLLANVLTLRLNGLELGDISFIASLTTLEVLDLRCCYFNELPIELRNLKSLKLLDLSECILLEKTYNRAIGKCSQLEELYASKCYPDEYVHEIILDIGILQNLQRFVLGDPIIPESTKSLQLRDFNISKLRTSNKNILQIAETFSLKGLHGGCKNIIPDMVGFVGGMNKLSSLHLTKCEQIECIFDATCNFLEYDLIPRLVELRLNSMNHLTELCHGPPQQVLQFFEKLQLLDIDLCTGLHIIFPRQCNLQNLKILRLYQCKTDEVLFSESVARSLQQLEELAIGYCINLKHLIASGGCKHGGFNTSEEIIPAPANSHFFMTNLREVEISTCESLESIFPIFYVEGLPRLQKMDISNNLKLKYVFGECDHERLSSYQYQNHVLLPHLEALTLSELPNLTGMCPEHCHAKWPPQSLWKLTLHNCPKFVGPWFNFMVGYDQRTHHLNENSPAMLKHLKLSGLPELYSISDWAGPAPKQMWSFQCLQRLKVARCYELKCVFSMETPRSLPELMELCIYNCQELEQIVAANE